jgi:transposase
MVGQFRVARPSKYGDEFKRDAVRSARSSDRPIAAVARELGVNHETLRTWVREAESADTQAGGASVDEREELKRLRKRVAELLIEKETAAAPPPGQRCPARCGPGWPRGGRSGSRVSGCAWRQRANLSMAAGVTGVKKLTRLPSGSRNSSDRLPQGIVVGSLTKSVTKPVRCW